MESPFRLVLEEGQFGTAACMDRAARSALGNRPYTEVLAEYVEIFRPYEQLCSIAR